MDYTNEKVKQAGAVVQSFVTINKTLTKFTLHNATSLGLTLPQMGILNTINYAPEITLSAITDKLQLPKSTVSTNVEELVRLGLIERKTNDADRREIRLTATVNGQELAQKSTQNASSYRAMMFALENLPEEDIQVLTRIHSELLHYLQEFTL
ncbi:MAG: MarR family winged helix-turn-helix transcriptional regulator [Peptococcaceae bacterium]|nr:MarR family winged helix-turn-helix transcriptional regulator [Peptococcaceae bacterium]